MRELTLGILLLTSLLSSGCTLPRFSAGARSGEAEIRKELDNVDCGESDRFENARALFERAGVREEWMQEFHVSGAKNLLVNLPGRSDETIIVGAHHDKTDAGCGTIDNWSGIVILSELIKEKIPQDRELNYVFVAFGGEEKGLLGSKGLAENLKPKDRKSICAMVNLDSFGFDSTWALDSISSSSLVRIAKNVAKAKETEFETRDINGASSDSMPFRDIGIPAITFTGLPKNWKEQIHNSNDRPENVDAAKVYEGLEFAVSFLESLESVECSDLRRG